jgi:hypothetical protein
MTRNRTQTTGNRCSILWLSLATLLAAPGCAQWNMDESLAIFEADAKPQTPDNVLAVWTDTTLNQPGKPVVRGFGGRVMFFVEGNEGKAIPVDGALSVYAFDDDRSDQHSPEPEKKFLFPAENLTHHRSDSSLGPSYSFWLPWDPAGGPQRRISLLTRFEDKNGKLILSKAASVTLPGTSASSPDQANNATPTATLWPPQGVQQAAYEQPLTDAVSREQPAASLTTTTIEVAPGQAQRLLAGPTNGKNEEKAAHRATTWGPLTVSQQTLGPDVASSPANASAAEAAAEGAAESATGSPRGQSPARTATATRPTSDPIRRQPHRAEWPRSLPPTPRSGWSQPPETTPPNGGSSEHSPR